MIQPKVAETYEPLQLRHVKNVLLDILDGLKCMSGGKSL